MFKKIIVVLLIGLVAWAFQATRPPPPRICGSPGGPEITASRIKLRDGRHLAYKENGVPKETAKYKIIFSHAFGSGRHDASILKPELAEELGVHLVSFDRPGYGQSDPDPKRTMQSLALDIEELADKLELGSKFYVMGYSMGGQTVWGCLKYIPHRLAGAALIAPVVNYWWPGFPENLHKDTFYASPIQDIWALRVAHYAPWLTYWWNTQKWFPSSTVVSGKPQFSPQDMKLIASMIHRRETPKEDAKQQGEFESIHRDLILGFGSWEFDPMDLENPFVNNEGSVHLWQGKEDSLVPLSLQRHIAGRLPWLRYHEVTDGGHLFPFANGMRETIFKTLLLGEGEVA
ncbi:3-oxoadipate enol-lactonase [Actinidia chinensis var. chinensis]|uniref:3-oxoadipate enol-lactonase n=1 Tax=Actinidia chinensis var. chinensis TaxID=1590841 RepID=A0A2R6PW91_ACTCC|nr:3-oxoadipate enol-lactonase [Actinidia chinensis var. chinensis]